MIAPDDVAALVERCPKPGCGAQKIIGHPCYDWDCPQQTLTAVEYRQAIATQAATIAALQAEVETMEKVLTKINAIRNSIIGFQSVGWSEHIYPLVAALHEAGYEGEGYEVAREEAQTLLDRVNAAEAEVERAKEDERLAFKAGRESVGAMNHAATGRAWKQYEAARSASRKENTP